MAEVMILGATGRTGRAIAARLDASGTQLVLFGRDRQRLEQCASTLRQRPRIETGSLERLGRVLAAEHPGVVVSTVGPFASTAATVIDALPQNTHYLDLSNEYASFEAVSARDPAARRAGQTLISGAGFGVVATESVLVALTDGHPTPTHVRVDALPSVASEGGAMGAALAGSIVDSVPLGRRQVQAGQLVTKAFDDTPAQLITPDGDRVTSINFPSGDLFAAWHDSNAANVISGSTEIPAGPLVRYALPALGLVAHSSRVRLLLAKQMAKAKLPERPRPRAHSWGHAKAAFPTEVSSKGGCAPTRQWTSRLMPPQR
ncbi:MAG: hypothetical protein M3Y09_01150 [Actinomycetota bacterium]|nr:hypothetical protein [Actinomycetota bacterium]